MKTEPYVPPMLKLSERVYRALLVMIPAEFRREYGLHMTQVFRDMCRDAYRQGGSGRLVGWWALTLLDLLQTVIAERRKGYFTLSQAKFIQLSGWLCILGGIVFAASSISQLQPGSHYTFQGVYQLSIYAIVPGMTLIAFGLIGMFMRFNAAMNLFGRVALVTALVGAGITALGWLLTLAVSDSYWYVFIVGFMLHLAGVTVFGGYVMTERLFGRWSWVFLPGSALPLTLILLSAANQQEVNGANWGSFLMLMLVGIGWVLTGIALNSKPASVSIQSVTAT